MRMLIDLLLCLFYKKLIFKLFKIIILILKCIRIKDVNNLVARRHYEIIGLPA